MHLGSVGVSRNGGRTAKGWNIAICMLLASVLGLCLMLWITPPVHADDSAGLGITATDDITDTQNLLGSNVSEITDACEHYRTVWVLSSWGKEQKTL